MALKLGMTVRELLARMSSYELTEWKVFFDIRAVEQQHQQEMYGQQSAAGPTFG